LLINIHILLFLLSLPQVIEFLMNRCCFRI